MASGIEAEAEADLARGHRTREGITNRRDPGSIEGAHLLKEIARCCNLKDSVERSAEREFVGG